MAIRCLRDLSVGDIVAVKPSSSRPWYQTIVLAVTDRSITVESDPSIKFKKVDGFATKKEAAGYQISIVTPEIQEDWDRRAQTSIVRGCLAKNTPIVPIEAFREALSVLVLNNHWNADDYVTILKTVMDARYSSSGSLRKVAQILQDAIKK
jgi:hypothetical protein